MSKIHFGSQVRTLQLKFYVEQLMPATDRKLYTDSFKIKDKDANARKICTNLEAKYCTKLRATIENFSYQDYKIAGIYHDKDTFEAKNSPFVPALKKGHWHVIIWRDGWKSPKKRFRVGTIVKMLGLAYAPKLDDSIWKQHGAEVLKHGVASFFAYLFHETDKAIEDGKYRYSHDEVAKNFSDNTAKSILAYYQKTKKKTDLDWDILDSEAIERGLEVKDYDDWIKSKLSVSQRSQAPARIIHADYQDALRQGVTRLGKITRCSILIYGKGNAGKTYTTAKTLEALGLSTYDAPSGSGKYDGLLATHDAITFNDVGVTEARNVFDNRAVVLHRRNSGDRPWVGNYAIVTTNNDPNSEIRKMAGITRSYYGDSDEDRIAFDEDARKIEAIKQRLYICYIDTQKHKLVLESAQTRGSREDWQEHDKLFNAFLEEFNRQLQSYHYADDTETYHKSGDWRDSVNRNLAREQVERSGAENVDEKVLALSKLHENEVEKDGTLFTGGLVNVRETRTLEYYNQNSKKMEKVNINLVLQNLIHFGRVLTQNYILLYQAKMNQFFTNYFTSADSQNDAVPNFNLYARF